MSKAQRALGAAALGLVIVLQACAQAAIPPTATPEPAPPGGTLRIVVYGDETAYSRFYLPESDPAAIDPHLDVFTTDSYELYRCCLARTLLSTNGRSTEEGGVHLYPDLAAEQPEISEDGLSWTFALRDDLYYGPPLDAVKITAHDIVRSFHRMLSPALAADAFGAFLFTDIVGGEAYSAGEAASISGLETPNSHTLIIRLTRPAGDLGARLALPLVVPIPASPTDPSAPFGVATGHDDGYGRFVVSSGPYMIEGSASLDFSRPADEQTPLSGLVPGERLVLVRNPSWDPGTDELRRAASDGIELSVGPSFGEAASTVHDGDAHVLLNQSTAVTQDFAEMAQSVAADPSFGSIHVNQSDTIGGVLLNSAQPPFDDLEVRRAVAFVIDKAALVELVGPYAVRPAHHLVPDAMQDNLLVDYRPYPSIGDRGDTEAAKEHMRLSAYDTDGDGLCDAESCREVVAYTRDQGFFTLVAESVREDLAEIGIELDVRVVEPEEYFGAYEDPAEHVAMFLPLGWVKDSLSPASFFVPQFYSPVALATSGNGSLVGASAAQLADWGYEVTEAPNVDDRIAACLPLIGSASYECWAALDQHMMENVVASISFGLGIGAVLVSASVEEYHWDQLVGAPSFDQIVVAE